MGDIYDEHEERFNCGDYEDDEYDDREEKTCNRCGTESLIWIRLTTGWRLFDETTNELHKCPQPDIIGAMKKGSEL